MYSVWRYPFALLGIVFVLIGYAFWPSPRIPVLIFHDIASTTQPIDGYTVEATLLARELDYLKGNGYTPLTFAAVQTLKAAGRLPDKPIIITFDDALPGQSQNALAVLKSKTVPATFFINSELVGDSWHMQWSDVRAIADAGMEIGGHSLKHSHLKELDEAALNDAIAGDKKNIEHEIGRAITVFAYPYQERNARTDAVVNSTGYTIVRDTKQYRSVVLTNSFDAFLRAL